MKRSAGAWTLGVVLALVSAAASAQVVNDPTRPPAGYAVGDPVAADAGGGLMLQSVMISPTQKAAIINGVVVKLGEKYGDAVLIQVSENEVVLKGGGARQVLKLHPGVDKREPTAEKGAQGRSRAQSDTAAAATGSAQPR